MKKLLFAGLKVFNFFPERKKLSYVFMGSVIGIVGISAVISRHVESVMPQDNPDTTRVMTRLNDLQLQLEALQSAVKKPLPGIDLSSITQQMNEISSRFDSLKTANAEQLHRTLNHTEKTIAGKLDSITAVVSHIDAKQEPIKFLATDKLPFKVISIDSIQQIPVASIFYDFKTVPLEKGDSLAGWRVVKVDYGKQRIEFENKYKDHVLVNNEHIG